MADSATSAILSAAYSDRLVRSGIPAEFAAVISAAKYNPSSTESLLANFAAEQALLAAESEAFQRTTAASIAEAEEIAVIEAEIAATEALAVEMLKPAADPVVDDPTASLR